ncbi:uncharacterized protein LOC119735405 [Patiria miniata]|uniref:Uncharacterized protein n=1 Tax=Patiria miniata TaxID=46514 RepID=A0A914AN50_PATMI|nr:uncharacterized protein LOC119735405 [Patiria miniata]
MCTSSETVHVFDIRKETHQCVIRTTLANSMGMIKIKDGVMGAGCLDGRVRVFDARTGQMLHVTEECWPGNIKSLFFDGELIIASTHERASFFTESCYIHLWGVPDGKRRRLTMDDATGDDRRCDFDYRNKLLAAAHSNNYIHVWDASSGKRLHKLKYFGEKSQVRLGDNVVVGFSADRNSDMYVISIWSLDTGECQKETSFLCVRRWTPYLVNNLIIIHEHLDTRSSSVMFAFDLLGTLVTKNTMIKSKYYQTGGNGSKCSFYVLIGQDKRYYKEAIFEATASGLVRLFDVDPDQSHGEIIWMDEIRIIRYAGLHSRLFIHHFW